MWSIQEGILGSKFPYIMIREIHTICDPDCFKTYYYVENEILCNISETSDV